MVSKMTSIFSRRADTRVPRTWRCFRKDWKYYKDRARSLKASEARRIGRVLCENIARSSTFRWTPQRRNGYYSKQKNSSMRVCNVAKKRFRACCAEKFQQQEIIDARTRLRSEEAVIYSPRFVSPTSLIAGKFEQGLSGYGRKPPSGGAVHGYQTTGCPLSNSVRKHELVYLQYMVVPNE